MNENHYKKLNYFSLFQFLKMQKGLKCTGHGLRKMKKLSEKQMMPKESDVNEKRKQLRKGTNDSKKVKNK